MSVDQTPCDEAQVRGSQAAGDRHGLAAGWPLELDPVRRGFFALPLAHSETVALHERNLRIQERIRAEAPAFFGSFAGIGASQAAKYLDVIRSFGRFPHRNEMLGRADTAEERAWLAAGGAARMPPDLSQLS